MDPTASRFTIFLYSGQVPFRIFKGVFRELSRASIHMILNFSNFNGMQTFQNIFFYSVQFNFELTNFLIHLKLTTKECEIFVCKLERPIELLIMEATNSSNDKVTHDIG